MAAPSLSFIKKPNSKTALEGAQVTFLCNATGSPVPTILWYKDGIELPGSTSRYQFANDNSTLTIKKVDRTDQGTYSCNVSNSIGPGLSSSATLTVNFPPTMKTALPQFKILQLGQTLRLKCDVYGDPEPSFKWTKRLTRKEEKILLTNQKKYHLEIPDVRVKDAAFYGCTAKNKVGSLTLDEVFVDVNTSLDIINSGQTFNTTEGSSTTIKCIASSDIPPKEVTMSKNGKKLKTETDISKDGQLMTATLDLTKVTTDESGTYTCVARNRQKQTRAYFTLTVHVHIKVDMDVSLTNKNFTKELYDNSTEEYRNLEAEFIGQMRKVYENEIGFERVEVLGFSNGSVLVQFRVVYRIKVENPEEKPPPYTKVRIANVLVRRVKKTDGVFGNLVLNAESLKPRVLPPAPRNLTAINIKKTSLTVNWRPPLYFDHYSVEKYVIKCKEFSGSWKNLEAPGKHMNTFFLDDLEPDTSYSIQAHAMNHVGEGLPSKTIEIKTLSDFWSKFTKIFVPIFILLLIGVIVLLYMRRQRIRREVKRITEVEGKRCYDEFQGGKELECIDAMEMAELPMRCSLIPRENLELGKELGSGQFGVVYKGFLKEKEEDEGVPCAVKMLKPGASESDYRDLFNELDIMCSVDEHPNIVNLLGACRGGGEPLYVVVEFADNGCLLDYLRENRTTTLDEGGNKDQVSSLENKEKIRIALDIAKGMAHLASHKSVHRDLAARNVLLGKDRIAKVADFGLARDVYEQGFYEKSSTSGKLPVKWMSLEALETLKATSESDVWSFGVLMWEIETGGKMPYAGLDYMEILKALKSGVRLQKPSNCSEELYSIMKDCWEANPEKRPKFEVLSHVLDNLLRVYSNATTASAHAQNY